MIFTLFLRYCRADERAAKAGDPKSAISKQCYYGLDIPDAETWSTTGREAAIVEKSTKTFTKTLRNF
jgi:hypothetical protein